MRDQRIPVDAGYLGDGTTMFALASEVIRVVVADRVDGIEPAVANVNGQRGQQNEEHDMRDQLNIEWVDVSDCSIFTWKRKAQRLTIIQWRR